ncbi:retropepsin-like aspartic protease family protein [Sphingomonas profundi]|uniref:retropepsin-like aspartic protease family protein n=1 Tax=Alterirhizorhabdus profundi TaxID=2681549 RepID=UPI0012E70CC0|nr:retropepsin-like aspartic protease [Sphingomonas profundi]
MTIRRMRLLPTLLAACAASTPLAAQVRIVVDGQVQEVPDGVVRTITVRPGGARTVRDTPFRGEAMPGSATITTTETIDEDARGRTISRTVVTRIEPVVAIAYARPTRPAPLPPRPAPRLQLDAEALGLAVQDAPAPVRIPRDPATGHFVATIRINGVPVRAIVDTGAANTILSARDAWATGAAEDVIGNRRMIGIGGLTVLDVARLRSFEIAGQQFGGISAAIGQQGLDYTLLGQTELVRLGRIVIEDGVMTISPHAQQVAAR